jgi:hypothetical protein
MGWLCGKSLFCSPSRGQGLVGAGKAEDELTANPKQTCHPDRSTRISCHVALTDVHVCGFPLKKAA